MFKSSREYKAQMLIEMSLDMIKLTQVLTLFNQKSDHNLDKLTTIKSHGV